MTTNNSAILDFDFTAVLTDCISETNFPFGVRYQGKVRDTYELDDKLVLVTTDRLSAFDRVLATIPFKGQVLNLISAWWFQHTEHLVPNHLLAVPDPNIMVAKKCRIFPIEVVVRGYITGTTNTALWTQYHNGVRNYCGVQFPEGLIKNQRLAAPVLTPTTKDKKHDRLISPVEIIQDGWMSAAEWDEVSGLALELFNYGSKIAAEHGLILVDTKYEFGLDQAGQIVIADELHTPDSSRYWLTNSYSERFAAGQEPESIDKEFLRLWFAKNCDPYHDQVLPAAPPGLIITLAQRYITLYEIITGNKFNFARTNEYAAEQRMMRNLAGYVR